ncbi:hypothetical protein JD76_05340 [Micromonospora endolithica]|nr:hypothetical protein JD76_05340 [Micromonospora endolithica]
MGTWKRLRLGSSGSELGGWGVPPFDQPVSLRGRDLAPRECPAFPGAAVSGAASPVVSDRRVDRAGNLGRGVEDAVARTTAAPSGVGAKKLLQQPYKASGDSTRSASLMQPPAGVERALGGQPLLRQCPVGSDHTGGQRRGRPGGGQPHYGISEDLPGRVIEGQTFVASPQMPSGGGCQWHSRTPSRKAQQDRCFDPSLSDGATSVLHDHRVVRREPGDRCRMVQLRIGALPWGGGGICTRGAAIVRSGPEMDEVGGVACAARGLRDGEHPSVVRIVPAPQIRRCALACGLNLTIGHDK